MRSIGEGAAGDEPPPYEARANAVGRAGQAHAVGGGGHAHAVGGIRPVAVLLAVCLAACGGVRTHVQAQAAPAALRWERWSAGAFARARAEDKLLLIDVSAGWCHWCHVMDAVTYADPVVAGLLAAGFVAIRVDADARPDLAERYRRWGWPATAILTPDARPILERRGFQEPRAFARLLARLAAAHAEGRPLARVNGDGDGDGDRPTGTGDLAPFLETARAQLDAFYDPGEQGWGGPQKYPYAAPIEHAFLRATVRGESLWRARALATLAREQQLVDPVWGGMYQYSVGGGWDQPHYEKLLSIQAGAVDNAAMAHRVTGDPRWLQMARGIHAYLRAFLRTGDGAFAASQDADVSPRLPGAAFYGLGDAGRRHVGAPRIDARVYADGNGLVIRALCGLYAATGDEGVLADARAAAERVLRTHRRGAGRFRHAETSAADEPVTLGDEVAMGRALLALFTVTGEARWLDEATAVADVLVGPLSAGARGGFVAHTPDPGAVGVFAEPRTPLDGNAAAARFLLALAAVTRQSRWRDAAIAALGAVSAPEELRRGGRAIGEVVLALEEVALPRAHLTVVGRAADPAAVALHRVALRLADPRLVIAWGAPGDQYPDLGRPAVYLCDDRSCSSPITEPTWVGAQAGEFLAAR